MFMIVYLFKVLFEFVNKFLLLRLIIEWNIFDVMHWLVICINKFDKIINKKKYSHNNYDKEIPLKCNKIFI